MKLYELELMKIRVSTYLRAAAGICACVLALGITCLFLGMYGQEKELLLTTWSGLYALESALTVGCFGVFAAVFAAKVIVDEYCGKKAMLLFTYPVSRKRILHVKSRMIAGITMAAAFAGNMADMGILYLVSRVFGISPDKSGRYFVIQVLLSSLLTGVLSAEIGTIATVIGWKKRSMTVTIVSAVILVCFVPNLIASQPKIIGWTMLLAALLLGMAAGLTRHMLTDGIEEMEV